MRRRLFVAGLASALPQAHLAQAQQQRVPLIGFLHPGFPDRGAPSYVALSDGLRDAGHVDGKTIRIEARWGFGKPESLLQSARELVQRQAAVLVVTARPSIEAARAATTELPIVANDLESDPVASGYVTNLARPGGNLTGFFLDAPSLCGKWLQQIREIIPHVKRIAVLWDSTTGNYQLDAIVAAARTHAIDVSVMEFRESAALESALELGLRQNPQAVIQLGSPLTRQAGQQVGQILANRRVPGMSQFRTFPDGGGLISYGPDLVDLYRRLGVYVSRILGGVRPGDLPIERPHKFELVVNLKAARTLQLTIPGTLLATADDVIE